MDEIEKPSPSEVETPESEPIKRENKRIKDLSEKVELTSKERDTYQKEAETSKKEAGFYKDFSGMVGKFPAASEYQDKIKEKVLSGYSVNDAVVAVLANEGKYSPPQSQVENPAGGSAPNSSLDTPKKEIGKMTQAERKAALVEAELRGEIGIK